MELLVNGQRYRCDPDPTTTLLDVLRDTLGLTGAKRGCDRGECGACTVLVDDKPIYACLALALSQGGRQITTVEGLENDGALHPIQRAFAELDALQCGFCTPGQIMSAYGCIAAGRTGSDEEVRDWMSGNLCRCAAYPQIVAAVRRAAEAMR